MWRDSAPPDSRSASPPREPPSPKSGRDDAATPCRQLQSRFQKAEMRFSQRSAVPFERRGERLIPIHPHKHEGAERRKAQSQNLTPLRQACEARRGEACTHLAMRPPPGAPPRHLQASRSMGVAPSTPGRVSGNRHWRQPVQRAPRRAPVSGARAGSGAARVRGYEPRPQGPHLAPSSKRP